MRSATATAVMGGFMLAWASVSESQCVSYAGYSTSSAGSIGIYAGYSWGDSGKPEPPIGDAIAIWEDGCAGTSGEDFPSLLSGTNGSINIAVEYMGGQSPSACARFAHDLNASNQVTGGAIEIYATDNGGADCSWMLPHTTLKHVIAHEIGHALGLANTLCAGYLMGPDLATSGVNGEECGWVDEFWTSDTERQQQELDACNSTCPTACTGTPPTCPPPGGGGGCEPWWNCSPLILDLNGDGIHTTGIDDTVMFDLTGDGNLDRIGWTDPSTEEAFLWVDLQSNGRVDDGKELFGSGTLLPDGRRAANGFVALAEYDKRENGGNGDGQITTFDEVWNHLRLWVDGNHDGICAPSESGPIERYGLIALALTYWVNNEADRNGNIHHLRGSFTRRVRIDGVHHVRTFALDDVFFVSVP